MKKIGLLLCCLFLMIGCDQKEDVSQVNESEDRTTVIKEGDYTALLPYEASSARIKHGFMSSSLDESFAVGTGLMERSKEYFSSDDYSYREGVFLTYDALDAVDDSSGILGRTSEKNPNGMNPTVGTQIETNNGMKKIKSSDILLVDVQEIDWYKSDELGGLSLAIILNDEIGDSNKPDVINENKLLTYGEEVGRKIVNYLRKTHPEIGQKTPIYVTLFKESSYNSTLPGVFIEEVYFSSKTIGEYKEINEEWALFPSEKATSLDGVNSTLFERFNNAIVNFFPVNTSVIATGHFEKGSLDSLKINITMRAKTWQEVNALIQKINSSLSIFNSTTFRIKVSIFSDDILVGAMVREIGSEEVNTITLAD